MKTPRLFRHSCKYNVCKISSKPLNKEQMIDFMIKTNRSFFSYFDYKYHVDSRNSGIYHDFFNSTSKLKSLFEQLDNLKDKDYLKVMLGYKLTHLFQFDLSEYNPFYYFEISNNKTAILNDFYGMPFYPLNDEGVILFIGSGGRYVTIEQSFKFFKKLAKKCPYLKLDVSFGTYSDYNNAETYTNVCNFKIYNGKCKITKYNDNHYNKVWSKNLDKFKEIYPEFFEIKSILNKKYDNNEVPKEDIEYYHQLNKSFYDKINNQMQPILNEIAKKIDMGLETSNIDLEAIHQEYYN